MRMFCVKLLLKDVCIRDMGNNISHFIADGNIFINNICENKNCIKVNLPSECLNDTDKATVNCIHEMINVRDG